ncbi:hypothetical protein Lal_00001157 [Lupinus albus]|nr:hypothetical protein Lal_00001157 [Lupinus albus]
MEEQQAIADYLIRIHNLINLLKVLAIEESKDLENFKTDELQGSLEAHEQRFIERQNDRQSQQALSTQFKKTNSRHYYKYRMEKGKWHGERRNNGADSTSHGLGSQKINSSY